MKQLITCLVFLVATPTFSFADSTAEMVASRDAAPTKYVSEYLSRLKQAKKAIFYDECRLKDGGKAAIIVPIGEKKGLYLERTNFKTVVNTAEISWVDGKWQTEVAQGGVYTITRANNLIAELLNNSFQIIWPDRLDHIATSKPKKICTAKQLD